MFKFTDQQKQRIEIICDTFIPSLEKEGENKEYWKRKASDLPIVDLMEKTIDGLPIELQEEFKQLADLLGSPTLGLTWFGSIKTVDKLSHAQREKMLLRWSRSPIPQLRNAYNAFKKLVCFYYFGHSENKENPNWRAIGYPGLFPLEKVKKYPTKGLSPIVLNGNEVESCDVVIIGSGAGGGVVAAELAAKGLEVLILEKGSYLTEEEMSGREVDMLSRSYDRGGAFTTKDGSATVLAGSCVGGGTTINWSASFRTPDWVLEEWAKEHDNPQFLEPEYKKHFEYIEKRSSINTELSVHNPQNSALFDGAKKLGYHAGLIPRNVAHNSAKANDEWYWKSQGYGGLGDACGYKQGTMKTFLQDAIEKGARIYADTEVDKINISNGTVTGVTAFQSDENGHGYKLTVSCKKVVVCAGAVQTPAVLMRSGLSHPQLGKNLYFHPTNAVSGIYDRPMESWYGPMMSAVCDEFNHLDGNFGYKLETPPLHSGFIALSMPWESGEQFKSDMLNAAHTGAFIVLTRDKYGGKVTLSKEKKAMVHYRLHKYDRNHLVHGMMECAKIHAAAGARKIRLLHNEIHSCEKDIDDLDAFVKKIKSLSWAPNRFTLYTAHQMGTCRMGGRKNDHPLTPEGAFRGVKGLWVADGSSFPRCSGVNPMLSIMALSRYISQHVE